MKRLVLTLALLAWVAIIHAQSLHLHLALQSGLSTPLFDYAQKDLKGGSFALPGFSGSLETRLSTENNWGGFLQIGLQLHPIDVGSLGYEKVLDDPFLKDLYIRSDPFRVVHLVAGPAYQFQTVFGIYAEGQLAAGLFYSSTPYQLYKPEYFLLGGSFYEITSANDFSFVYGAGIRFSYMVAPWYKIGISNQILHSKAAFDFVSGQGHRIEIKNITFWNASFLLIFKLFPDKD